MLDQVLVVAQTAAQLFEPLSVPLMVVVAVGVWKVERRVLKLEISLGVRE